MLPGVSENQRISPVPPIQELDLGNQIGVTVLAIKREEEVVSHPSAEFSLKGEDSIFVVGHSEQLSHCMNALAQTENSELNPKLISKLN